MRFRRRVGVRDINAITGGARRYSMRISACVLRYVLVASAVGAPTGRRLRGGCNVGFVGV